MVGWVVGHQDFHVIPWHFEVGASIKIDVLAEDGGLLLCLPQSPFGFIGGGTVSDWVGTGSGRIED